MSNKVLKLLWYGQSVFALLGLIGGIWASLFAYWMLSGTGSLWHVLKEIYSPVILDYIILLAIIIGSLFRWLPTIILSLLVEGLPSLKNVYTYLSLYDAAHHGQFGQYGRISIAYGVTDIANYLSIFGDALMVLTSLMLFILYLRYYYRHKTLSMP